MTRSKMFVLLLEDLKIALRGSQNSQYNNSAFLPNENKEALCVRAHFDSFRPSDDRGKLDIHHS